MLKKKYRNSCNKIPNFSYNQYNQYRKIMKITLTKKQKYNLEPYGKFAAKFDMPKRDTPNILYVGSISMNHDTAMPVTEAQEEKIINIMKKYRTDVLIHNNKFYTITGSGLTEINHEKLRKYKNDPAFKELVDNGRSF
jgi:hypothetical protein